MQVIDERLGVALGDGAQRLYVNPRGASAPQRPARRDGSCDAAPLGRHLTTTCPKVIASRSC